MYIATMKTQGIKTSDGLADLVSISSDSTTHELLVPRTAVSAVNINDFISVSGYTPFKWDYEIGAPSTISTEKLFYNGHNAPLYLFESVDSFEPCLDNGASRYRIIYSSTRYLDSLLINKGSDVLVVYLHGATSRCE